MLPLLSEGQLTVVGIGPRDRPRVDLERLYDVTEVRLKANHVNSRLALVIDSALVGVYDAAGLLDHAAEDELVSKNGAADEVSTLEQTIRTMTGILSIVGGLIAIALGVLTFRLKQLLLKEENRLTVVPDRKEIEIYGQILEKQAKIAADTRHRSVDDLRRTTESSLARGQEADRLSMAKASNEISVRFLEAIEELLHSQGDRHRRLRDLIDGLGREMLAMDAESIASLRRLIEAAGDLGEKVDSLTDHSKIVVVDTSQAEAVWDPSDLTFRVKIERKALRALVRGMEEPPRGEEGADLGAEDSANG